jgi:hypothetical protein
MAAQRTRGFGSSQAAQLVKRDFKLESSPAKTGGTSAGDVVPFENKNLQILASQISGCGQASIAGANYDYVIIFHHGLL